MRRDSRILCTSGGTTRLELSSGTRWGLLLVSFAALAACLSSLGCQDDGRADETTLPQDAAAEDLGADGLLGGGDGLPPDGAVDTKDADSDQEAETVEELTCPEIAEGEEPARTCEEIREERDPIYEQLQGCKTDEDCVIYQLAPCSVGVYGGGGCQDGGGCDTIPHVALHRDALEHREFLALEEELTCYARWHLDTYWFSIADYCGEFCGREGRECRVENLPFSDDDQKHVYRAVCVEGKCEARCRDGY